MFVYFNPNPKMKRVGDCVIRAVARLMGMTWEEAYARLAAKGYEMKDMPTANNVWGEFLRENGYKRQIIPGDCPGCYTVEDFCRDHPAGKYLLATGSHVVAVVDGTHYDTWDSSGEVPAYYWMKEGDS